MIWGYMLDLFSKHSTWEPSFELLLFQYGGKDGSQLPKMLKMAGMPGHLGKQSFQYNCIYLIWISVRWSGKVLRVSPYVDQRQHSLCGDTEARHWPAHVSPQTTTHLLPWAIWEEKRKKKWRRGGKGEGGWDGMGWETQHSKRPSIVAEQTQNHTK